MSNKYHWLIILALLVLPVCLIYSNTLEAPFYFDDIFNIEESRSVRLNQFTPKGILNACLNSPISNRPVSYISFALNYYLGYYNVFGYHIVNIVIHILSGLWFYLFLELTLSHSHLNLDKKQQFLISFFTALIWLVHPIQIQSVTYIVQRMNSMAAMFYALTFWLYIKGRMSANNRKQWLFFSAAAFSGVLALGSKEITASLLFFLFLYEYYFFQNLRKVWLKRNVILFIGIFIIFGIIIYVFMGANPFETILTAYANRNFTLTERVLTQYRVIMFYISLLVYPLPSRLSLLHDFQISTSLFEPVTTFLSIIVIIGLLVFAVIIAKKERLISFCILWFFGNLLIESSIVGLEIIFEHRTYLPSMFFILIPVIILFRYSKWNLVRKGFLSAIVVVFCFWTYERNNVWNDPVAFWKDNIIKSPNSERGYNNLGRIYILKDSYQLAIQSLKQAIKLNTNMVEAYINLGVAYTNIKAYDMALISYEKALQITNTPYIVYNNMGKMYADMGEVQKALDMYNTAISIKPDFVGTYSNLGLLYLNHFGLEKAVSTFQKALELDFDYADAHNNLGQTFFKKGLFEKGIKEFQESLRTQPNHPDATFNLGRAYELTGKYELAIERYEKSIQLNPQDVWAYHNAGRVSVHYLHDINRGIQYFKKALSISPDYSQAEEVKKLINRIEEKTMK